MPVAWMCSRRSSRPSSVLNSTTESLLGTRQNQFELDGTAQLGAVVTGFDGIEPHTRPALIDAVGALTRSEKLVDRFDPAQKLLLGTGLGAIHHRTDIAQHRWVGRRLPVNVHSAGWPSLSPAISQGIAPADAQQHQ